MSNSPVLYSAIATRQLLSEQHRRIASLENVTPKEYKERGKPILMMLLYVAGISERIMNYNIRLVFRYGPTLLSMLTLVKDPFSVEKQANVEYEVPCTCGKVSIRETKRCTKLGSKSIRKPALDARSPSQRSTSTLGPKTTTLTGKILKFYSTLATLWRGPHQKDQETPRN